MSNIPPINEKFPVLEGKSNFLSGYLLRWLEKLVRKVNGVRSGVYTPTITSAGNTTGIVAYECQWSKVDDTVTVSGRVDFSTPTVPAIAAVFVSLPFDTTLTAVEQCSGSGSMFPSLNSSICVYGDIVGGRAIMRTASTTALLNGYHFIFSYQIL